MSYPQENCEEEGKNEKMFLKFLFYKFNRISSSISSGSIPEEEESANLSRKSVSSSCENLEKPPDKDEES